MYSAYVKDNLKLFVGVVAGEPKRWERDGRVAMVVTLKDYQGEFINIYFNNGEPGSPRNEMRADRIVNARVSDGAFLTVLAKCTDPEEKTATGLDFKYRGMWTFEKDGVRPTTVLMGVACRPRSPKDNMFVITIPVESMVNGTKSTTWYDVTFFDSEYNGKKRENAKTARRILQGSEKATVVVIGGAVNEREYNGDIYHGMIAYRITKKPE